MIKGIKSKLLPAYEMSKYLKHENWIFKDKSYNNLLNQQDYYFKVTFYN